MARLLIPAPVEPVQRDISMVEKGVATFLFAFLLALNVALINYRIAGFPLRAIVAVALLGGLALIYPARFWYVFRQHTMILVLALAIAVLGSFVSAVNGTPPDAIWQGVMEVPMQVAISLLAASILANIAGVRLSSYAVVAVIGASTLIAVMQFVDIGAAWDLRRYLGALQKEGLLTPLLNGRPMGVSFSPIQLSTQICLAFAVFAAAREHERRVKAQKIVADPLILFALAFLVVGSLVTLTRSPILGGLIFFAIYALRRPGSWLLFLGLLGGVILYLIGPLLLDYVQDAAPRVIRTNDDSANARVSMNTFGVLLFLDNPIGYGFAFTPADHWMKFWEHLYYTPHPSAVTTKELHNYVLNMLNTYGIGILLLLPLAVNLLIKGRHALIFFTPYIVHIIFHNSGPFWTDVPFWFGIAALSAGSASMQNLNRTRAVLEEWDRALHVRRRWSFATLPPAPTWPSLGKRRST